MVSTKRRVFIFMSSAILMSIFIYFTLNFREDKPIDRWLEWLPGKRVVKMITEIRLADGETRKKKITFTEEMEQKLKSHNITPLEVERALPNASVYFSHDLTQPRKKVKQYVVSADINLEEYYFVVEVYTSHSEVVKIATNEAFK